MRNEARPAEHPPRAQKPSRWPWVLVGAALFLTHTTFFLPFRAVVPIPGWVDPWWAIVLVLVDETAAALLIVRGVAQLRSKKNGNPD